MKNRLIVITVLVIFNLAFTKVFLYGQQLKAGIAKVDITPTESLYMGGYDESCRIGPSNGNSGNIYIRSLVFDDSSKKLVFIEADIVSLPPESYLPLRELVSAETGIPGENIMLGCVHNHAAPSMDERNNESEWYQQFNSNIVKSVKKAITNLEPVKIGGGIGKSNIAMNRRKKMENTVSYLTFDENNSSQ